MTIDRYGCTLTPFKFSAKYNIYKGRRNQDNCPVIVKALENESVASTYLSQLRYEYSLLCEIDSPEIIKSYGLVSDGNYFGLLLEDFDGVDLKSLFLSQEKKISIDDFLQLSTLMVNALGELHSHGVIHKDINPSNIVYNESKRQIKIIDFGISTFLNEENVSFEYVNSLKGTLAYISPEQTGRMPIGLDFRSDYYSLGLTLFQILTGKLPFTNEEALELVHTHLTQTPVKAHELRGDTPETLSLVLAKLMEKHPDNRYQSAPGIISDLKSIASNLESKNETPDKEFQLGRDDFRSEFYLSKKLYGRKHFIDQIIFEEDTNKHQKSNLLIVSGPAGIGKSSFIQELYLPITMQKGYFISAKFDEHMSQASFLVIGQALESLATQLLSLKKKELIKIEHAIQGKMGANLGLLLSLCPDFKHIVGDVNTDTSETYPFDRLLHMISELFSIVVNIGEANKGTNTPFSEVSSNTSVAKRSPIFIFFDDLQWADRDFFKLLEDLTFKTRNLPIFFIGAYRDNEVSSTHPLILTLNQIKTLGTPIKEISLTPLSEPQTLELINDSTQNKIKDGAELAAILYERTAGNPFFLKELLTGLSDNGFIFFNNGFWHWEKSEVLSSEITENVVNLILAKLQKLDTKLREVLVVAACIGSEFEFSLLNAIYNEVYHSNISLSVIKHTGSEKLENNIWQLVLVGFLLSVEPLKAGKPELKELKFRFVHDKVRQAVLLTEESKSSQSIHYAIVKFLRADKSNLRKEKPRNNRLDLDVADHFNQASFFHKDITHLEGAKLNLVAAKAAFKQSSSHRSLSYVEEGVKIISDFDSEAENSQNMLLELLVNGTMAAEHSSNFAKANEFANRVICLPASGLDKATVKHLQANICYAEKNVPKGTELCIGALGELGIDFSEEIKNTDYERYTPMIDALVSSSIADEFAVDITLCESAEITKAMEILDTLILMSFFNGDPKFRLYVYHLILLESQHGSTPSSTFAYIFFGVINVIDGNYDYAEKIGEYALSLSYKLNDDDQTARTLIYVNYNLLHWKTHHQELATPLLDAYRYAANQGNPYHAACAAATRNISLFIAGEELNLLAGKMSEFSRIIIQFRQEQVRNWHEPYRQVCINLTQECETPYELIGDAYDENISVPLLTKENDVPALMNFYYCKALVCYIFEKNDEAYSAVRLNQDSQNAFIYTLMAAPLIWVDALARLAVYNTANDGERAEILSIVKEDIAYFEKWKTHNALLYEHKYLILRAELSRVLGDHQTAINFYNNAIKSAERSGYLSDEAMINEIAGRFYIDFGDFKTGRKVLRDAYHSYLRWGATVKCKHLETKYPTLLPSMLRHDLTLSTLCTIQASSESAHMLDMIGALQVSQAINSESSIERLLVKLMSVLVEVGGAESGFIGLIENGNCVIRVTTDNSSSSPALISQALDDSRPETIVNYTTRTERTLNISNASEELPFSYDPYVIKNKVRSVFCHPLIWQENLLGLLYLENNLAESLFTDRALILELLSGQVVSSLENARLQESIDKNDAQNEKITVPKKDIQFIKGTLKDKKSIGLNSQDIEKLLEVLSTMNLDG